MDEQIVETPLVPDADLTPAQRQSQAFKANVKEQLRLKAIEDAKPKPTPPAWTDHDANLHGDDPVAGHAMKVADAERAKVVEAITRMTDQCVHRKSNGERVFPQGMAAYLLIRGFNLDDAKAACEHFAKHGFWRHGTSQFGIDDGGSV